MKVMPAASKMTASMRERSPSSARRMGSMVKKTNQRSCLTTLEWMRIDPPTSATRPKMSVKSAMLLPRRVPIPISGAPSSALMMEMSVSGSAETSATTMNEVMNSVSLSALKYSKSAVSRQDDRAVDHDVESHARANLQSG